ncbi:hypothetical protein PG984_006029 [Apiospora sp. TS-2023a]
MEGSAAKESFVSNWPLFLEEGSAEDTIVLSQISIPQNVWPLFSEEGSAKDTCLLLRMWPLFSAEGSAEDKSCVSERPQFRKEGSAKEICSFLYPRNSGVEFDALLRPSLKS